MDDFLREQEQEQEAKKDLACWILLLGTLVLAALMTASICGFGS